MLLLGYQAFEKSSSNQVAELGLFHFFMICTLKWGRRISIQRHVT